MSVLGAVVVTVAVLLLIAMVLSNIARGRHSRRLAEVARQERDEEKR